MELFVYLGDFERELEVEDYSNIETVMRNLMKNEFNLTCRLNKIPDIKEKIAVHKKKMEELYYPKSYAPVVLASEEPMLAEDVEQLWLIGLNESKHIHFIKLVAVGNIEDLIDDTVTAFKVTMAHIPKTPALAVVKTVGSNYHLNEHGDVSFAQRLATLSKLVCKKFLDYMVISQQLSYSITRDFGMDKLNRMIEVELAEKWVIEDDRMEEKIKNKKLKAKLEEKEQEIERLKAALKELNKSAD
jgi:hypothetical protein